MKHTLALICVGILSGCATPQPERLSQRFCAAHQGYWQVVADTANHLSPEESEGIRFMHSVVSSISERESEGLRILLNQAPQRVQTGPSKTPWVLFELTDTERHTFSSVAAAKRHEALFSEWLDHPRRKQIQSIWRQAASDQRSKAAWQAKDKKLNSVIKGIEKLKSRSGQQKSGTYP